MKKIQSPRLFLELMDIDDAQLLYELDQDAEVMKYINGGQLTSMETINNILLPRMSSYRHEKYGWGLWKVMIKESNEFIGWILVRPMSYFAECPEYNNIELGWRFKRKSWGLGYATEAAKIVKDALLVNAQQLSQIDPEFTKINLFTAIAIEENIASINIMKKLGLTFVKKDMHHDPLGDQEVVYYQLNI